MSEKTKPLADTVPQFAEKWGLARTTVYDQCAKGLIPHIRLGTAIRIPHRVSEKLLEEAESK